MRKFILLLLIILGSVCRAQDYRFIPQSKSSDLEVIKKDHFVIGYKESAEQPEWVSYHLAKEDIYGKIKRTDDFRKDPSVSTGSASLSDYKYSGYDRGHLAPAADFNNISELAMSETFYLSNMSPQKPVFNRQYWRELESQVRDWAYDKDGLYVITGPVLGHGLKTIGSNHVAIPNYYYKVLYDENASEGIAFVLSQDITEMKAFSDYAISIDSIERMLEMDFFAELPDQEEKRMESSINFSAWLNKEYVSSGQRCIGWAKSAGRRCKIKTRKSNRLCRYHQSQVNDPKPYLKKPKK